MNLVIIISLETSLRNQGLQESERNDKNAWVALEQMKNERILK